MSANPAQRSPKHQEVFERLNRVLLRLLKIYRDQQAGKRPSITWETDLVDDLGVDSLETLDLMNAIEEEFDINPNIHDANWRRKVHQVVDYIVELLEEKKP